MNPIAQYHLLDFEDYEPWETLQCCNGVTVNVKTCKKMRCKIKAPHGGKFGALLTALFLSYGKICLVKLIFHRNVATIAAVRVRFKEVLIALIENVQLGVGQGRILIKAPIQLPQTLQMRVSKKYDKLLDGFLP